MTNNNNDPRRDGQPFDYVDDTRNSQDPYYEKRPQWYNDPPPPPQPPNNNGMWGKVLITVLVFAIIGAVIIGIEKVGNDVNPTKIEQIDKQDPSQKEDNNQQPKQDESNKQSKDTKSVDKEPTKESK